MNAADLTEEILKLLEYLATTSPRNATRIAGVSSFSGVFFGSYCGILD